MVIFCDNLWRESEGVAEYKNGNKAALRVTAARFGEGLHLPSLVAAVPESSCCLSTA